MATIVHEFNAQNSTFNTVGGDLIHNTNYYVTPGESSGPIAGSSRRQPSAPTPGFNDAPVDLLSVHFTGRQQELTLIANSFARPRTEIPLRCVLYGDQGVGKSQLTYKWSKSTFSRGENMYVMWMSATTVEKLDQGFSKLLHLVEHPHQFQSEQMVRLTAARRWLEEVDSGNWLLVLDNVSAEVLGFLREHLPRKNGRGSILFTTRTKDVAIALANAAGDQHAIVQVPMLSIDDGVELFLGHFRGDEMAVPSAEAKGIVNSVGCLPLAISHAAAYMQQSGNTGGEMLALYRSNYKINVIGWQNSLSDYEYNSVAATFENQLEDLEQNSPDASNLLKVLAYFDPESIPLDMLVTGARAFLRSQPPSSSDSPTAVRKPQSIVQRITDKVLRRGELKGKGRADGTNTPLPLLPETTSLLAIMDSLTELRNVVTILQARCLTAYQDNSRSTLRIHDLIQLVVLEKTKKGGTHQQWFECAVELVGNAFKQIQDAGSPAFWPECEVVIPHIQSLTVRQEISIKAKARLLVANSKFGWYLRSRGRYGEAEELCLRVLADEESVFGSEDARTLSTMHHLAVLYREKGRYEDAEALLKRVLQVEEKKLGSEHLTTLNTMYSLAYVYFSQKRLRKSEELFKKVLHARRKQLGSEHIQTLGTKNMLALVYYQQHRYNDAKMLYMEVLHSTEEQFGPDHFHSAWTMNNLGLVHRSQGHHDEAEKLFKRVLSIWENQLGSDHPNTLLAKHNLSMVYESQGQYHDAEELLVHVLARREEVLGRSHPHTRGTMNFLASMYEKLGRFDDAAMVRRPTDQSR